VQSISASNSGIATLIARAAWKTLCPDLAAPHCRPVFAQRKETKTEHTSIPDIFVGIRSTSYAADHGMPIGWQHSVATVLLVGAWSDRATAGQPHDVAKEWP
jgi:hypothetical protein